MADGLFWGKPMIATSALPGTISGQPELRTEGRNAAETKFWEESQDFCKEVAILNSLHQRTTNEGFNAFNHQAEKKAPVFPVSEPTRMIANLNGCWNACKDVNTPLSAPVVLPSAAPL